MSKSNIVHSCPYAQKCGGCQLQNMDYERQLAFKQASVIKLLGKFRRVENIIGMDDPYHYRNKVGAAFGLTRGGKIISGVYQSSSHRIVNVDSCLLENERADEIIVYIRSVLSDFRILPYNEDSGKGFLRHVLVKHSEKTKQTMVVFVGANPVFPQKNNITKALVDAFPDVTTVLFNMNPKNTSMVLGEREEILYGPGYIEDILCGCRFRISAKSFYQINPRGAEILYDTAIALAAPTKNETLVDAYCGTGTIGIVASRLAGKVIGVELNKDAVRDAKINAKINKASNAHFYCDDAGRFMTSLVESGEKIDTVIMDPPRAGSSKEFTDCLKRISPEKIVYVSCNPETQERDIYALVKGGYTVKKIVPVDMFPMTKHVETVVLLSKGEIDKDNFRKVKVDFSLEDMDLTEHRGKATYAQVKEYILNEFGLKVSSLYIAQVKKKCGIETGENHNLPKSEDARQPQVTPEKEEAIMKAFRHFGVI